MFIEEVKIGLTDKKIRQKFIKTVNEIMKDGISKKTALSYATNCYTLGMTEALNIMKYDTDPSIDGSVNIDKALDNIVLSKYLKNK